MTAAVAVGSLPFDGNRNIAAITTEGSPGDDLSRAATTVSTFASPGYFELMGMRESCADAPSAPPTT